MRNSGALAVAETDLEVLPFEQDACSSSLTGLFRPLPFLLASGGDDRLIIDAKTGANMYGCGTRPVDVGLAFSSSTATTISETAYRRADRAREELIARSIFHGFSEAFEAQIENMRHSLKSLFDLGESAIMFSPSGTDSQLLANLLIRQLLDGPFATVVVGADQTGSGTTHTARGRHFSDRTAQSRPAAKGTPVAEGDIESVEISLFSEDGAPRSENETDAAVIEAIDSQIRMGRKIILQSIDSSKLGWRAPSDACLREVVVRWPDTVQIVVDACQMRMSEARLGEYLDLGCVVLLTGSKFFSGPAFSGASLWPKGLSTRVAALKSPPSGFADYATQFDTPRCWTSIREGLPATPNFGQWLRWEAALEEMKAYFALPQSWRSDVTGQLAEEIAAIVASSPNLKLLSATSSDANMPATIFPFFVTRDGRMLDFAELTMMYRALNRDISAALPTGATRDEHRLASLLCQIGQPVKLAAGSVLRIAIGARTFSQAWSDDEHKRRANVTAIIGEISDIARKIDLILAINAHFGSPI